MKRFIELSSALLLILLGGCQSAPAPDPGRAAIADPYLREAPAVAASAQADFDNALAAMRAGDWPRAERQLLALHQAHPQLSGPLLNLALIAARDGRADDAERRFQQSIETNANNLAACNQYAIWLREQGRFADAEKIYLQALARWPDHADSHLNLGILYDLYRNRPQDALRHYQRYLELNGGEDATVSGWVLELQRRLDAAKG